MPTSQPTKQPFLNHCNHLNQKPRRKFGLAVPTAAALDKLAWSHFALKSGIPADRTVICG
jgi:hypothetical protein